MTDIPVPDLPAAQVAIEPLNALTPYDEVAAQFVAALKAAIALIPRFVPRHPETEKFVQRYLSFSDDLIPTTISSVEQCPELAATGKFDVPKARAGYQFNTAFRPVIDMVEQLGTDLEFTCRYRKAEGIASALQTYAIGKGIGRDPSSAGVAAHVAIMKRDLKRPPRSKTTKANKTPATDPTKPTQ